MKTRRTAATTPTRPKEPKRLNSPRVPKLIGSIWSGHAGTLRFHPSGLTMLLPWSSTPVTVGPTLAIASMTKATTVIVTIEMMMAPFTLRTHSATMRTRPSAKTRVGQPASWPPMPSSTGTGPAPVRRTKPASTRPMSAMNRPMPTEIATLSCAGTAWKTACRNPVSTRTRMITPSRTTRPMASAHVILLAMAYATNALRPSPVASASG